MLQQVLQHDVLTLTFDHPARGNALGPALVESLLAALTDAGRETALHTVVLRAAGPHFCTGLDLSDLEQCSDGDLLHRLVRIETLLATLWHAPWRTIAMAQGRCWGAGADLFAVCDERIAAADTRFRFPGAQFGIVLGTRRLAERVGSGAARQVVIEGGEWDASTALALGFATAPGPTSAAAAPPAVSPATAWAIRTATRADQRDADLAALVRSAAAPGLKARIEAYRERLRTR